MGSQRAVRALVDPAYAPLLPRRKRGGLVVERVGDPDQHVFFFCPISICSRGVALDGIVGLFFFKGGEKKNDRNKEKP